MNKELTPKNNDVVLLKDFELFLTRGHSVKETIEFLNISYNLKAMEQVLLKGGSFASALKKMNYTEDVILLIRINEESGNLASGIYEAIELIELRNQNRHQIINQLRYPLFLLVMIFCVVVFVDNLVLPQILNLYASFGVDIPFVIGIFLSIIEIMPYLILGLVLVISAFVFSFSLINFETKIKYIGKIPYIGQEYRVIYNVSFISYMHSLLKSKITLKEAIEILSMQNENKMIEGEAKRIKNELAKGEDFVSTINNRLYLSETIKIFNLGLSHNNLLMYLQTAQIKFQQKQRIKKQRMFFLIQPIIYLVIGIIIIIIYGLIFNICYGLID